MDEALVTALPVTPVFPKETLLNGAPAQIDCIKVGGQILCVRKRVLKVASLGESIPFPYRTRQMNYKYHDIREIANKRQSWAKVASIAEQVYGRVGVTRDVVNANDSAPFPCRRQLPPF